MYENKAYENKDGTQILPYENKAFYSIWRSVKKRKILDSETFIYDFKTIKNVSKSPKTAKIIVHETINSIQIRTHEINYFTVGQRL